MPGDPKPGDPKQCRAYALQCSELADRAKDPKKQKAFDRLALSWVRLAAELDSAQSFLETLGEMDLDSAVAKMPQAGGGEHFTNR